MRQRLRSCYVISVAAALAAGCIDTTPTPPVSPAGSGGGGGASSGSGGASGSSGSGGGGGGLATDAGPSSGSGGGGGVADAGVVLPPADAGGGADAGGLPNDAGTSIKPFAGPFVCTEMMGMLTTGEWYNAGFEDGLGAALGAKWQGRFAHYGYVMEYARPTSYVWTPTPVGGVNNVNLTTPCTESANAPDRIVYQAWSWELTTQEAWVTNLEAALATIRAKRPSARRIELMTIVRCPMNGWCHADKPPLGPDTDHNAAKQDCHVPEYVDAAFAQVAAAHPELVSVAPKFEAHACAANIDGIHLGGGNRPVASDIAAHYKTMP